MKGRLNYGQINAMIDELNKTFTAKYLILRQKKSKLNDANRKRFETFKSQENKDTKGRNAIFTAEIWFSHVKFPETIPP